MSTGQTLRVCGGALLDDLYVLQLLPAVIGSDRAALGEPDSSALFSAYAGPETLSAGPTPERSSKSSTFCTGGGTTS